MGAGNWREHYGNRTGRSADRLVRAGVDDPLMHLADLPSPGVGAADASVALLPVGSTEQHGPHAPLGTDTTAAVAVAEAGAAATDESVLIAPPITVGVAEEHRHFAGTLWVEPDTFRAYVRETVASLASHGTDRVVVVNGHGGNVPALREACGRVTRDGDAYAVPFTWFDAVDDVPGHGGPLETSLLLHVAPEDVHEEEFEAAATEGADRWGEWVGGVNLAYDTREFSDNGVVGDPGEASAQRGEALLETAGDELATLVERVAGLERPD
jgi:creatinine amidohydrolase